MKLKKNMKIGVSIMFLLLIFTASLSLIEFNSKNGIIYKNSPSTSPAEDLYEPNNFYWDTNVFYLGEYTWLSNISGSGIQLDDDYFRIYVYYGYQNVRINLTFLHTLGDLGLELCDYMGTPLFNSTSITNNEFLDIFVPYEGDYYIRVFGDNFGNTYDLIWESYFSDDEYEINNDWGSAYDISVDRYASRRGLQADDDWAEENDDFYQARMMHPVNNRIYYLDLKIVNYDEDWFQLYLMNGDVIDVGILFDGYEDDLDLELYNPTDYYTPQVGSYTLSNGEHITFTANMDGDWRIRVYRVGGTATDVEYSLDILLNKGSIRDDSYEENDFDYEAYDISQFEGMWLSDINGPGIQFDEDWYKIYVETGFEHLIVNFGIAGYGLLDIYDEDHNLIPNINSPEDHETFRFDLPSHGIYYIKVYGSNLGDNYNLQYLTVFILEEQTWVNNVLEGFDVYLIDVSLGFRQVDIDLLFNNALGNISMTLLGEDGQGPTESYSRDGNEYIDKEVQVHGKYYLIVHGSDSSSGGGNSIEYDLWWDDIKTDTRSDDSYEINNNASSAHVLSEQHDWGTDESGLQFDQDWYKITVESGFEHLFVVMKYDIAEGMIGFQIYDVNLTEITGNFSMVDDAEIDHILKNSGIFYIKVYGDNTGNVYSLWYSTSEDVPIDQIPGYDMLILIISIVGVSAVVIKKKRSKFKK